MDFVCPVFACEGRRSLPLRIGPCDMCHAQTVIHPVCPVCARKHLGVRIRPCVDGHLGTELAATREFRVGDLVAPYTGEIDPEGNGSPYGIQLRNGTMLSFVCGMGGGGLGWDTQ